jgi:mono/diheme cytochrome c family protein
VLRQGLGDSQMPRFTKLTDKQIAALVDYVIYLSMRGELERSLLFKGATDLDLEKERIFNPSPVESMTSEEKSANEDQLENANQLLTRIARRWLAADRFQAEIPRPSVPILGTESETNRNELVASVERGKALFLGEQGACAKCHGEKANGLGVQSPDYDDWTKEWTSKIGIKPTDETGVIPLMARGGLKPQPLKPRNITEGHFRGGREPEDLYRRIKYGIPYATMPEAAAVLTPDDIWHIVNYILSIANVPAESAGSPATKGQYVLP